VLSSILRLRRNNDDDDDDDNGLTCAVDSKSDHASMGGMKVVNVSQHATTTPDCVICHLIGSTSLFLLFAL